MATYKVGANGKAPSGLKAGDKVVTAGGTYTISGTNASGGYSSAKDKAPAAPKPTSTVYGPATGNYSPDSIRAARASGGEEGTRILKVGVDGKAPADARIGDYIQTAGGAFKITGGTAGNWSTAKEGTAGYGSVSSAPLSTTPLAAVREEAVADPMADIYAKSNALIQQQTADSIARVESQKGITNSNYDDTARQAYIASMQSKNSLPEQLALQGVTGGASETALLKENTGYENNITGINKSRQNALTGLDSTINDIQASGDYSLAESGISQAKDAYSAYQTAQSEKKSDFADTIGAYSNDYQQRINELLAQGYAPDSYEILALNQARNDKKADIATAQAEAEQQAFLNALKVQAANKKSSSGGGGSSLSRSTALSMYKAGITSPEVLSVLGLASGTEYLSEADQESNAYATNYSEVQKGVVSPDDIRANAQSLIAQYGVTNYNALLKLADENYSLASIDQSISQSGWKGSWR